jgi:hypothetical protein
MSATAAMEQWGASRCVLAARGNAAVVVDVVVRALVVGALVVVSTVAVVVVAPVVVSAVVVSAVVVGGGEVVVDGLVGDGSARTFATANVSSSSPAVMPAITPRGLTDGQYRCSRGDSLLRGVP